MFEALFYLGSIVVANLLVMNFGIIQVAGLSFPAGAVAVGFTFTARDLVQRRFGKWGCWIWMFVASGISAVFSPTLALASLGAFVVAEGLGRLYSLPPFFSRARHRQQPCWNPPGLRRLRLFGFRANLGCDVGTDDHQTC